jgi:hypothetical protein
MTRDGKTLRAPQDYPLVFSLTVMVPLVIRGDSRSTIRDYMDELIVDTGKLATQGMRQKRHGVRVEVRK